MIESYKIKILNYKKRQKKTLNREWVVVSTRLFDSEKIQLLMQEDPRSFAVYVWMITNKDVDYDTETLEIRKDFLATRLKLVTGIKSNNFKAEKYLQHLKDRELIEIVGEAQLESNLPSTSPQLSSNSSPTSLQLASNSSSTTPVEQAETLGAVFSNNINNTSDNDNKTNTHSARECDFENFIEKGHKYLLESGNDNIGSGTWAKVFLKDQFDALKVQRPDLKVEEILFCWKLICDSASSNKVRSPEWYRNGFAARIKDFKGIDADYGKPGAKKKSETQQFLEALEAGKSFRYKPNNTIYTADQLSFVAGEFPMVHIEPVDRLVGLVTIEIVRDPTGKRDS